MVRKLEANRDALCELVSMAKEGGSAGRSGRKKILGGRNCDAGQVGRRSALESYREWEARVKNFGRDDEMPFWRCEPEGSDSSRTVQIRGQREET